MSRKSIIIIVIIAVVIIVGVLGFFIYKKNKDKKTILAQDAANKANLLQAQLNANPNMPPQQKAGILEQLAALALQIQAARDGSTATPPIASPNPLPGLGGGIWVNPASFPLMSGSNNSYVANLQLALNKKCGKNLVADGKFGPLTQSAVQSCIGGTTISTDQYKAYTT
jgi:peptidoglycan hydrolase-like protein with peptidoglycan-binding domain